MSFGIPNQSPITICIRGIDNHPAGTMCYGKKDGCCACCAHLDDDAEQGAVQLVETEEPE